MNNIEVFLKASTFAVAGASQDRSKYGNKVFRAIVSSGRTVYPLNPTAVEVEKPPRVCHDFGTTRGPRVLVDRHSTTRHTPRRWGD